MSALRRGPHGGGTASGRSTPPPGSRDRGASRGGTSSHLRGRGGRGRGAPSDTNTKAEGLLQGLQTGSFNKRIGVGNTQPGRGRSSTQRGPPRSLRNRGTMPGRANASSLQPSDKNARANPSQKDFMAEMTTKFQDLKQRREGERSKAIRDGFLADPEKKTSLDKAITPVGTCTEMCPEFERVERIVQNMVEKQEKEPNEITGRDMPAEERMVKRFRRSAAGYDEQLPSDIRTPATLRATLNYLLVDVVGGSEQLAPVHKFVWDRTRGIRNDFSIQQVSKDEDVRLAVDCFEKIARFHILSLHQLSNPDNVTGEGFDAHQEREQLNNTLLSLIYYYDDNRDKQQFPNEAEFRAYCIIFELQSSHPDLEDRMQSWPPHLLNDRRVQTAFRLYSAATNTLIEQGPLKPTAPFSIAQGNSGAFWKLLASKAVSYMMSCVAEIYFGQVRYMALQNLWRSHKGPSNQQVRNQEWTLDELTDALAFDDDEEALDFCQGFGLKFKTSADGIYHLDFTNPSSPLDQSSTPSKQVFSHSIVEAKRYRRSLGAVINGIGVARSIREGLVEANLQQDGEQSNAMGEDSKEGLFFPENGTATFASGENQSSSTFNLEASIFKPGVASQPSWSSSATSFGKPSAFAPFATPISTSTSSTSRAPSGSSFLSFLPTSSITSSSGFGIPSTHSVNSFTPKAQSPANSSTTSAPAAAPFTISDFKLGQSTSAASPVSASSPSSLGKPSTAPSTFNQQSGEQQQSSIPENPGEDPVFLPRLPAKSTATSFSPNLSDAARDASPLFRSENEAVGGPPRPDSKQPQQDSREPAHDQQAILRETLSPQAFPRQELDNVNDEAIPPNPPPPPRPAQYELSEDSARPLPSFLGPGTGSDFHFDSPFTASSNDHALAPRKTQVNNTQPPTTAVFAPSPPQSFETSSRSSSKPSALNNTPQPSFSWTTPAPSVKGTSNDSTPTRLESPFLPPSQHPAPFVPPKFRKTIQPKVKELKAVSPRDPTPRDSSPLRERPVIFGDNANAFTQSAAFAINPPTPRTVISENDRDTAAENVARLAILQPAGLMEEYLQFTLPDLLRPITKQHEREKPILAAKAAHRQNLAKIYFKRWRANTYRRVMNRRARDRRQMRIDALGQEKQRMRGEAELEAILQAKKEKEHMQAEILARGTEQSSRHATSGVHQTAGQKRKSIHVDRKENFITGDTPRKIAKGHHRSRTMGHVEEPFDSPASGANRASVSTSTPQSRSSIFSGRSISNETKPSPDSRRPLSGRKDTTRTDYFRLKALGIDPDTPIVPETKASLERKRQREEDSAIAAARTRARTLSPTRPGVPRVSPRGITSHGASGLNQPRTPPNAKETTPSATKVGEDDDLLRQIREVREAMTEDTEWFKTQAVNIEKEIDFQDELRRNTSHASSRSSPHLSASALARANGYEYLPGPEIPGRRISRTEQRIRRTGAHGLATRPIGGSGHYLAVAMSKNSAARLNVEMHSERVPDIAHTVEKIQKSRRETGEKDSKYIPEQSDEDSEELEDEAELKEPEQRRARCTNGKTRASESMHYSPELEKEASEAYTNAGEDDEDNLHLSLEQSQYKGHAEIESGEADDVYEDGDDEEEQYGDDEEEQYDEDEQGEQGYEQEEEEEEAEEGDEVRPLPYQQGQKRPGQTVGYWLRSSVTPERGLTPNGGQTMSRASSGIGTATGASADDALVLDSD